MREPWFWRANTLTAQMATAALTPFSIIYDAAQRLHWMTTKPAKPEGPVICIGNATLGGVGKTPFALLTHRLLHDANAEGWFLTRGYGGRLKGPVKVDPATHQAEDIGDEAMLLAAQGPTILSAHRPDGANTAFEAGADTVIMDDGFQNPTLQKKFSILLIDAVDPQGNGRIFPAGPLREPIARARNRADLVVAIKRRAEDRISEQLNVDFEAWLEPSGTVTPQKVIAFTGIGIPSKFFLTLSRAGFDIVHKVPFANHHFFTNAELSALRRIAKKENAALITTEKDYVRLPQDMREEVLTLPVVMKINDENSFKARLLEAIDVSSKPR